MPRCPACGGAYGHVPDLICRGAAADDDDVLDGGDGSNSMISVPPDELTDEDLVQVRGLIGDAVAAHQTWAILFGGLLGKTSRDLVQALVTDGLHVQVLRLPSDLPFDLALVGKDELPQAELQSRIRTLWRLEDDSLFEDEDATAELIALPDRNELTENDPRLAWAIAMLVSSMLTEWVTMGCVLQPHLEQQTVLTLR